MSDVFEKHGCVNDYQVVPDIGYVENNGFQFIEIGYWDFNNIEKILNEFIKEAAKLLS